MPQFVIHLLMWPLKSGHLYTVDFRKTPKMWYFIKIRQVGAEIFHEDGRTDGQTYVHDEAFSNFAPQNVSRTKSPYYDTNLMQWDSRYERYLILNPLPFSPVPVAARSKA